MDELRPLSELDRSGEIASAEACSCDRNVHYLEPEDEIYQEISIVVSVKGYDQPDHWAGEDAQPAPLPKAF